MSELFNTEAEKARKLRKACGKLHVPGIRYIYSKSRDLCMPFMAELIYENSREGGSGDWCEMVIDMPDQGVVDDAAKAKMRKIYLKDGMTEPQLMAVIKEAPPEALEKCQRIEFRRALQSNIELAKRQAQSRGPMRAALATLEEMRKASLKAAVSLNQDPFADGE